MLTEAVEWIYVCTVGNERVGVADTIVLLDAEAGAADNGTLASLPTNTFLDCSKKL